MPAVSVTLTRDALERRLELGVQRADSSSLLPAAWLERAERMDACPMRGYVAMLGVALLARATDAQIDPFALRARQPNGYSARFVGGVLAGRARLYEYHLGTRSREPLAGQPWFAAERVDQIAHVRPEVREHHRLLLEALRDLAGLDADDALDALAAFLRVRLAVRWADEHEYDVCLSFAGEQRHYVERVARDLKAAGVRVFYDQDDGVAPHLWGRDLGELLDDIYRRRSRFCLMFISTDYARKAWSRHERRSALARALEDDDYVLPVRFDDTELPGFRPTLGYLDLRTTDRATLVAYLLTKLHGERRSERRAS